MATITDLTSSVEVTIFLKDGVPFVLHLLEVAELDGLSLALWVYGRSKKTITAYSQNLMHRGSWVLMD